MADANVTSRSALDRHLDPYAPSFLRALSGAMAILMGVMLVTGALLMTLYVPSPQQAWASVHYASYKEPLGWLVRGVHHFASHAMLVMTLVYVAVKLLAGDYTGRRKWTYFLTLGLVPVVLGLSVTGHLLPWDELGYWARKVETNIVAMAPAGAQISKLIQGGKDWGALSLTRFYSAHVVLLPLLFAALLWWERKRTRKDAKLEGLRVGYGPEQALRDMLVASVVLVIVVALTAASHGAPLSGPADPNGDYPARPEWFFMSLYQLRHYFHGAMEFWGTSLAPAALGAWLVAVPFVAGKSPKVALGKRIALLAPLLVGLLVAGVLGRMARANDAADPAFQKAMAAADERRDVAVRIATEKGVPPDGPLAMFRHDVKWRGREVFRASCASCHTLGADDVGVVADEKPGDKKKEPAAPALAKWSTREWIVRVLHEPDHADLFGGTPYKGNMPSQDVKPVDADAEWKAMTKAEMDAVAEFLFAEGKDPNDQPPAVIDEAKRKSGEDLVQKRCTICHLYKGKGDDGSNELAPELSGFGSYAWVRAQIENPASKSTYREKALDEKLKGHMPAFVDELSREDIDILTKYVRARARGLDIPNK